VAARIACAALCAVLVAGCAGGGGGASPSASTPSTGAAGTTADARSLTIAVGGPLSGPEAATGAAIVAGARIAADLVNATGGIASGPLAGAHIELDPLDDADDPGRAMDDVRRAIANPGVLAFVGSGLSDASVAAAPLAENAGLAYLATYASSPAILDPPRRAVFVVPPTYAAVAAAIGDEIVRAHLHRVALLHVAGSFGDVVAEAVRERVEAGRGEIVADETYPLDASAVDAQLARIREARPDAVAFAATPAGAAMIVREAAGTLAARLFDAGGAIGSPAFLDDVGTLADGVTGTAIVDPQPRTQPAMSLRDAYRVETGSTALPDAAAFSYEAVLAVASAVSSGARDRATLPAYLHRLQLSDTGLGSLRFDADGARLGGRIWIVRARASGLAVVGDYVQTGAREVERVVP
jgi:branched-chain amino acid transport system substrate-binding protein